METAFKRRVQARVSGRVQGVGFRYYADHVAEQLGVVGSVRNMPDGGIEAIAEADEATLHQFLAALRHGPHAAEVTEVATAWDEPTGEFSGFSVVS
jgi:acylphosphatase